MKIKVKDFGRARNLAEVATAIDWAINDRSRFKVKVEIKYKGNTQYINLGKIRLKESKPYCGSHPKACVVERQNRKANFLEGADWVEFNDRVNDALDRLHVSAYVRSAVCIIRKGTKRRMHYGAYAEREGWEWNLDEDDSCYWDCCGREADASSYPFGTPGLYLERT